jgi:hypothetical protein
MRFEVFMSVTLNSTVFRDVMVYSLVEVYWHFAGIYCLHLQGAACLAYSSTLKIEAARMPTGEQTWLLLIPEKKKRGNISNINNINLKYF